MQNFKFNISTPVYFGERCVTDNAQLIGELGTRAYVVTTPFPAGYPNIALADVKAALESVGMPYMTDESAEENPSVESIQEKALAANAFGADMVIGIGGGSALDTAKGIATILRTPQGDPYLAFYGHGGRYDSFQNMAQAPVIAVPTTAGPGSDMAPNLILTNSHTHVKAVVDPTVYCSATMLDPRYIAAAPDFIFYSGVLDALSHGLECSLNVKSRFGNRMLANTGFSIFATFREKLCKMDRSLLSMDDYGQMLLHASLMGAAVGQNGSALPHGMGYNLSQLKGVNHGYASCIFLVEYLRIFKDTTVIDDMLARCGFGTVDALEAFLKPIIAANVDFEVSEDEILKWALDFSNNKGRMTRHPEPIGYDEIFKIFHTSLLPFISPATKSA